MSDREPNPRIASVEYDKLHTLLVSWRGHEPFDEGAVVAAHNAIASLIAATPQEQPRLFTSEERELINQGADAIQTAHMERCAAYNVFTDKVEIDTCYEDAAKLRKIAECAPEQPRRFTSSVLYPIDEDEADRSWHEWCDNGDRNADEYDLFIAGYRAAYIDLDVVAESAPESEATT